MQNRNLKIDVLRGVAILFVILLHLNIRVPFNGSYLGANMPALLYKVMFWSGWYGVCIFFVISGFLITTSSLNKWGSLANLKLSGFYKMRFSRIFPLLVGLLLVLSLMDLAGVHGFVFGDDSKATLLSSIVAALTFSINWLEMQVGYLPPAWDVLWSLSIEEVFYIMFPIICFFTRRERYFIWFMALMVAVAPLFRTVWFVGSDLEGHNNFGCMDGIALGCIAAIVAKRCNISAIALRIGAVLGWGLLILVVVFRSYLYKGGITQLGIDITLLSLGVALLLIYWHKQQKASGSPISDFALGWLAFFGRNSYEVYLTHMFIVMGGVALFEHFELSGWWVYVLYGSVLGLSGLLGDVVARYYSNPLNLYLRRR